MRPGSGGQSTTQKRPPDGRMGARPRVSAAVSSGDGGIRGEQDPSTALVLVVVVVLFAATEANGLVLLVFVLVTSTGGGSANVGEAGHEGQRECVGGLASHGAVHLGPGKRPVKARWHLSNRAPRPGGRSRAIHPRWTAGTREIHSCRPRVRGRVLKGRPKPARPHRLRDRRIARWEPGLPGAARRASRWRGSRGQRRTSRAPQPSR